MLINFFPAIYYPEPLSIVNFVLICIIMVWSVGYLIYSIIKKPIDLQKYKFRLISMIALAFMSFYLFINQCIEPKNISNIDKPTYILSIALPQLILGILSTLVYLHLIKFSSQLNVTFIFSSFSTLSAIILFFSSVQNTIFNIAFAFIFSNSIYLMNLVAAALLFDIFTCIFIIYPTIKLLLSTLKLDSLKIMSRKTKFILGFTIFFVLCIIMRVIILVFIGAPEVEMDDDTKDRVTLIAYVAGPHFYAYTIFFLFIIYLIYFAVLLFYLDFIIISVEGTANSSVSVYLAASDHID